MHNYKKLLLAVAGMIASLGLSANEKQFKPLYNGKDLSGWTVKIYGHQSEDNFANTFVADGESIKVNYAQYPLFNNRFGHLYTNESYQNFHLKFDYRFYGEFLTDAPSYAKLNSGVMFVSQSPESMKIQQNWPVSVEMQLLADDPKNPGRTTGNMCSPGTDIEYQGKLFKPHCLKSEYPALPSGQWVSAELIVNNGQVIQKINGQTVLRYANPSVNINKTIKGYDVSLFKKGQKLHNGRIALQSEGHPIEFKNIRIKTLD
ncbi:3-keto-disaccharide hydrolase [Gayadomonas joobiniege]|uniref:3-keto-disaccharide hydrolase n=1 Tax=Gayadomonas joobiniege TaxID=1234606 RepID=UPI0003739242|nr:DUF1080 domain-containing protein [Gayadomonas joobiniege]